MKVDATHDNIWSFLDTAYAHIFIDVKNLVDLHKYRQRMADVFGLADKDNDHTLYEFKDEVEEFQLIMNEEIKLIADKDL